MVDGNKCLYKYLYKRLHKAIYKAFKNKSKYKVYNTLIRLILPQIIHLKPR